MVDSGHIEITVKPDGDDILLIVADDGIGMEPEQVAALLQNEPSDRTGIGVKNVNDRLRIYFGADVYKRQPPTGRVRAASTSPCTSTTGRPTPVPSTVRWRTVC